MRVIVVGLGAMGTSVAMQAALRGAEVVGVDRFARGHEMGSSNGRSRIIRQAYYEDPGYVPLLARAYELWRDLEQRSGERVLYLTGLLAVGGAESAILRGIRHAAATHGLAIEELDGAALRARYPTLRIDAGESGLFEPLGGFVVPEIAVRAFAHVATKHGAQLHFETPMLEWSAGDGGVAVRLGDGSELRGDALVLAMGPWLGAAMKRAGVALRVQRNVQVWFSPHTRAYDTGHFPAFLVDRPRLAAPLYGFPNGGGGVKAALHGYGAVVDPDELDREIDLARDVAPVRRALDDFMPDATGSLLEARACMYSLTPDEHFVIDRHPEHSNVILCGGFSGHGFKFASVVGEIGADLALHGATRHPIAFLRASRFAE